MTDHSNWKALATVDFRWKQFVREGNTVESIKGRKYEFASNISGDECRRVYEEVIGSSSTRKQGRSVSLESPPTTSVSNQARPPPPPPPKVSNEHQNRSQVINALMKAAAANKVSGIVDLLDEKIDIDVTDQFGWTMLMCACHSGAIDVVRYLLDRGANTTIRDRSGSSCRLLAKRQGHKFILQALETHLKGVPKLETSCPPESDVESFYCDSCKQNFTNTSRKQHNSSTVHLFNSHPRSSRTFYGIPEHNKGYQLLLKSGWDKETGLGPDGAGSKFPLKTVLKRDREGLGRTKQKSYVTHFDAHDLEAVEAKKRKSVGIRHRKLQIEKERHKERRLRRELNFS